MMLEVLMMVRFKGHAVTAPMLMMVMVSRGLAPMLMREQIINHKAQGPLFADTLISDQYFINDREFADPPATGSFPAHNGTVPGRQEALRENEVGDVCEPFEALFQAVELDTLGNDLIGWAVDVDVAEPQGRWGVLNDELQGSVGACTDLFR